MRGRILELVGQHVGIWINERFAVVGEDSRGTKRHPADLAESAVNVLENPSMIIRRIQPDGRTGQRVVIPGVHPDDAHRYMLYLFKATYGRYRPAEMTDKPEEWRFWDLSQPEVVRDIIQRHQQRVEALYANPEYHAEFESLARLTRESETLMKTKFREPEPVSVDEKDFVSYDTLMTSSLRLNDDLYKNSQATYHLLKALTNAVSRQYELDTNTARRLVSEVSARHYQEKYGPGQPSDDQRL